MTSMLKSFVLAAALAMAAAGAARAQSAEAPAAIEDAAWFAGRWVGEGLGGVFEETWAPPAGGQMVGHFRLLRDGAPAFYEIMLMDVVEAGLRMRVKHFHADFVGWEEKHEWHTFEPVSAGPDALVFNGLAIRRLGAEEAEIVLRLRRGEAVSEATLRLRRAPL